MKIGYVSVEHVFFILLYYEIHTDDTKGKFRYSEIEIHILCGTLNLCYLYFRGHVIFTNS